MIEEVQFWMLAGFGAGATVAAYALALALRRRVAWLHPLLITCLLLMGMLALFARMHSLTLADYEVGGSLLTYFLGPATVALAIPLYRHRARLRRQALEIGVTVFTGCMTGIVSAVAVAMSFHASREILLSVMSKSVTTPIAIEVTRALGGEPEIAAALVVFSGLFGAVAGPTVLKLLGLNRDSAVGLAMGVSSHGIGTSSVLRTSELQGTYAGLAMALNGILTAAILVPLAPWVQRLL